MKEEKRKRRRRRRRKRKRRKRRRRIWLIALVAGSGNCTKQHNNISHSPTSPVKKDVI